MTDYRDIAEVEFSEYTDDMNLTSKVDTVTDLSEMTGRVIALEAQIASLSEIKKNLEELKAQLKTAMEKYGLKRWETPGRYTVTLVADTPSKEVKEQYFDESAFRKEHPELFGEYQKIRTVVKNGRKGYVRITAPKEG